MSSKHNSFKWVKEVRGLASNPKDNDYLKVDYIDVNLNNSRKLIANINSLTNTSDAQVNENFRVNESLIKLQHANDNLKWIER